MSKAKPVREKSIEKLPVELTAAELAARADELASLFADHAQVELEFEQRKQAHKSRVSAILSRQSELARELREKEVPRDVEVETFLNFDAGVAEITRLDTGELVRTRALSIDELQLRLLDSPRSEGAHA